ncbi:YkvA family protein [Pseudonocardia adelaidensis]|uniref:YkvA family protein n=1 Tax=Pseudonocardia adelaidensis TaxID=648754 RepID=UPI0031E71125
MDVATIKPRRIAAFTALWRAVTRSRRPGSPTMGERLSAIPRMLSGALTGRYPALSRGRLGLILLGLAYLVSPLDLLPEAFIPLLGLADDGVVALWLGGAFIAETERFLAWEKQQAVVVNAPSD